MSSGLASDSLNIFQRTGTVLGNKDEGKMKEGRKARRNEERGEGGRDVGWKEEVMEREVKEERWM